MSQKDINAQMAAALASDAGETVEAVTSRVEAKEDDKASKLAQMLAQASEAHATVPVKAKPAKAQTASVVADTNTDKPRQRRNYDVPTRCIHVFKSVAANAVYITSNLLFDNKDSATQVDVWRRAVPKPGKRAGIINQEDLMCETVETDIPFGDELTQMKADLHDKLKEEGYVMFSNRPKVKAPAKIEAPVVDQPAAEEVPADELNGLPVVEA